jgi:hypothetical protein
MLLAKLDMIIVQVSYEHSFIVHTIVITIVNYNHKTFIVQATGLTRVQRY